MFLTLERLCERAGELGSHTRRYIRVVQRHRERVVARLDEREVLGRISFGDPAPDLRREMDLIASVAPDEESRLDFLSFYYALQYIIMEIHCLDVLKYHLIVEHEQRAIAYRRCYTYAQTRFTELASVYLGLLAERFLDGRFAGRYAILSVGTLGDRDDIDVAVVDDLEPEERGELTRGLARLAQVMLRTSCTLHFHLAEELGPPGLSASLERYEELAARRPFSPVVISQLLCATQIAGADHLSGSFARRVTGRFFFHPGRSGLDHEGFLRAVLGEVHELLQRPIARDYVNPKEDGLRAIKGFLVLGKAIHHVPAREWTAILDFLRQRNPHHESQYAALAESFAFLETARYLYQLVVVEDEEIDTRVAHERAELGLVAELMGFQPRGGLAVQIPFLMAYYDQVDALKESLGVLLEETHVHLRRITSLAFFFEPVMLDGAIGGGNLAMAHASGAREFFGTRYWRDMLDELGQPDSVVPGRYVRDLARLKPHRRSVVMRGLVAWGVEDAASFLRFLSLIHPHFKDLGQVALFRELLDLALERWAASEYTADQLAGLFALWPAEVHSFLRLLGESHLTRFEELASGEVAREEMRQPARLLRRVLAALRRSSRRYRAHFDVACERHPQALRLIGTPGDLRTLADTLYGQAERFSDLFSRREWLESYHHLESTRLGLEFFEGRAYPELLGEYRIGMHILLRSLYFLCRKELYGIYRMEWSQRHSIAIFLDAGCSGFHPFERELRAGIFLFQEEAELVHFFREVVSSFHDELLTLGLELRPCSWEGAGRLLPRRLEEHRALLDWRVEAETDPLARLEVLKLNRIIGTTGHLERFGREVIEPLLAPVRDELPQHVARHLDERRAALEECDAEAPFDVCKTPGGIRDFEILELFLCARSGQQSLCPESRAQAVIPEELRNNVLQLHALATARRILRWEQGGEEIEAAFVRRHADLLALRPELPAELLAAPGAYLHGVCRRNLELMSALVGSLGESSP